MSTKISSPFIEQVVQDITEPCPEPSRKKKKMIKSKEQRIICDTFKFMLSTPFNFGVSPIRWDVESNQAKIITNEWEIIRYRFTITTIVLGEIFLFFAFIISIIQDGFQITNIYFAHYLLTLISNGLSVLLHIHTAVRKDRLVAMINGLISFWIAFTDRHAKQDNITKKYEKDAIFLSKIFKFLHHGLIGACTFGIPTYLIKCEFHLLEPILPMCSTLRISRWWPINLFFLVVNSMLQVAWCLQQFGSIVVLIVIIGTSVVFSRSVWKQLSHEGIDKITNKTHSNWIHTYRYLQLLSQYMNDCFASDISPSIIFCLAPICSILFASTVKIPDEEMPIKIGCLLAFFMILSVLGGFLDYGAKHYTASQEFIWSKRMYARRKYLRKLYWSCLNCASFRVQIGPFFYLGRFTVAFVMSVVFEYTGALLILAKK